MDGKALIPVVLSPGSGSEPMITYDPNTDSMYVHFRQIDAADQRVDDARDLIIDLDVNGDPIGYDIQYASQHPDVIIEALGLLRRDTQAAA
jgi:uncharacterized protein YuzE